MFIMSTMKRSIRAAALAVALCATAQQSGNSATAFSPSRPTRSTRALHMVSSTMPPPIEVYSAPVSPTRPSYGHDHSQEEELLRQISEGMKRRQQQQQKKRRKAKKKKIVAAVESAAATTESMPSTSVTTAGSNTNPNRRNVRIIRTNPNASGKVAQMTNYMPTESLTPSKTRRGRLLTLSKEEEGDISDSIQDLREVLRIRSSLLTTNSDGIDMIPTEAEWADACGLSLVELRRVLTDGVEGRTRLVAANTGLVASIAKRHYASLRRNAEGGGGIGTILTRQDLVQEGNLGLMEASERFDPSKGFRFSTYASYWIRQRISRSIADSSRVIRLPAHVHSMLGVIKRTEKEMEKELGYSPSSADVADRIGIPEQKLQLYSDASRNVLSLEKPLNAKFDDKRTLGDRIASRSPTPADDAEVDSLRNEIREAMAGLTDREREVIVARYGLDNIRPPLSVDETASRLGISRDRCRTIQARALHKLRHPNCNYRLKEYVGDHDLQEEQKQLEFALEQDQRRAEVQQTLAGPVETPESMWSF